MFKKGKVFVNIFCCVMILCSIGMISVALSAELGSISCSGDVSSSDIVVSPVDVIVEEPKPDAATIMMGGDVLIHDRVIARASNGDNTYDFSPYFSLFGDVFVADLNIVNLENPVDVRKDNSDLTGYPQFNCPREILDSLVDIGVDLCVTANNHSLDRGFNGITASLENVRGAGLETVGTYITEEEANSFYIKEINGIKIGVLAYSTFGFKMQKANAYQMNDIDYKYDAIVNEVLADVQAIREAGAEFVICSLHGGVEYSDEPQKMQERVAEAICQGGVDVLMGTHSHCVQPIDLIEVERNGVQTDALIIYSLGNLFANQKGLNRPKTQQGMIVSVKVERGEDGMVRLVDSFYMPTYCYADNQTKDYDAFMRLVPMAECALAETQPEYIIEEADWQAAKDGWERVQGIVGTDIQLVASPDEYPQGYFDTAK